MFNIRISVILIVLVAIIFKFTSGISAMNTIRDDGEDLLLKLRPVDPRALMMGDYMALAYDNSAMTMYDPGLKAQGVIILKMDEHKVGTYVRLDNDTPLSENEIKVKYALKGDRSDIGSARYYFQEGTAQTYEDAKYGVFKVSIAGHMVLVALADENYDAITPNSADSDKP